MARKKFLLKRTAFRYCPEKYKIKRKLTLFRLMPKLLHLMYWKYYQFHSCYTVVKMLIFPTHSMIYIWYSPKYPLCLLRAFTKMTKPRHPPSLIRVFAVRSIGSQGPNASSCGQRRLWLGWSESLLGAHVILLVLSWGGSLLTWTVPGVTRATIGIGHKPFATSCHWDSFRSRPSLKSHFIFRSP